MLSWYMSASTSQWTVIAVTIKPELLNAEKYGLTQCLKNLISSKDTLSRVSQLAHDVLEIFDKFPI